MIITEDLIEGANLLIKASSLHHISLPNIPINNDHRDFLQTLADLASQKSPIKERKLKFIDNSYNEDKYNEEFNLINTSRRPRAMSEPWVIDDIWKDAVNNVKKKLIESQPISTSNDNAYSFKYSVNHSINSSNYNLNGRIGIYTREVSSIIISLTIYYFFVYLLYLFFNQERNAIILRFKEKRKNRVWKKKIRYHCRKNLADSRVRIKGRFVKGGNKNNNNNENIIINNNNEDDENIIDNNNYDDDHDDNNEDEEENLTELSTDEIIQIRKRQTRRHSIAY